MKQLIERSTCGNRVLATAVILLFVAAAAAFASDNNDEEPLRFTPDGEILQEVPDHVWSLTRYVGEDVEEVTEQVNRDLEDGSYLPVGLDADPDIALFLIENDEIPFTNWIIYEFDDASDLEDEFTGFLADGWVPMDIARTSNGITALFVEAEVEFNGWQLVTSRAESSAIERTVSNLRDDGYTVWGQALDGEGMWHLAMREVGLEQPRDVRFETYPDDPAALQDGINEMIEEVWVPWGLSLSSGEIIVSFVR